MTPQNQRLPEEVYVRRRVAAVVGLLIVVALVVWGLVALASGDGEEREQTPPAETTQAAQAEETTESAESETSPETSESKSSEAESSGAESSEAESESETTGTTSAAGEGKQDCTLADLEIRVSSDRPSYGADASPTFYMQVRNPTEADCDIDLSENTMRFEVYDLASNRRIWSDVDCNAPIGTGEETFSAGEERNFQAVWSRTTSAPDRCSNRQLVPAGSFFLHGVIGQNASNSYTFNLG
ncbi:hypothetical protein COCCU_11940 [Corynebacterium occultum]|uniref:Uncharacterized protein n=1 Tax=Corynebacterium occultum TaxID=2675219 RepID=A0A6B8WPN2_9CORY|nr:hypothetical protein [Corynebacterium occultum]QGU08288.1 hypothetical protein COCCU_11940 [Corynebacterium occultum]